VQTDTQNIKFYPNPTNGSVLIESGESIQQIELYSTEGKLLQSLKPESRQAILKLNSYHPGIYFVKILSNHQLFTEKVVKN